MNRKEIISNLFLEISKDFEYAILHHIENIFTNDNDIDFIVSCTHETFLNFLMQFCDENKCFLLNYYCIDSNIYRFDLIFKNEKNFERLELDCACNNNGNDLLSINCNELILTKKEVFLDGLKFYKISDLNEFNYYIKKKAFKNSDINSYISYLKDLKKDTNLDEINNQYKLEKEYFKSKTFTRYFYLNKLDLIFKRFKLSPNISIGFLGSDGAGKSTIIEELTNRNLFNNQYYFHLKPIHSKKTTISVDDPHKDKEYSKIKSYFKILFFLFQYNKGWIKNILKFKIKPSLVIFDRYYDDILVDTKRYRYGGSKLFAKFMRNFIPRPDLYFILTTDADVIYKRKQEVPYKELERQIDEYRKLGDEKRYFNIDVNRTPEEVSNEIIEIIARKMNERF